MRIQCSKLLKPYVIHGAIKETTDAGESYDATCAIAIGHDYGLLGDTSKAVCRFVDGVHGQDTSNLEAFSADAQEAFNPFRLKLDGHRVCSGLLQHDKICRRWDERLAAMRSRYTGNWVGGQLQAMTGRIRDKYGLYLSLCRHFILDEWFMCDIFGIEFAGNHGTRACAVHAFGVSAVLSQECALETKGGRQALTIDGIADLEPESTDAEMLRNSCNLAERHPIHLEQHTEWKGEDLSRLPDSIRSLYTLSVQGETHKTIEKTLKFQQSDEQGRERGESSE